MSLKTPCSPGMNQDALHNFLSAARPNWRDRDLVIAREKLLHLGIVNTDDLAKALQNNLNDRLHAAGYKAFSQDTLAEFKRRLEQPTKSNIAGSLKSEILRSIQDSPIGSDANDERLEGMWLCDGKLLAMFEIRGGPHLGQSASTCTEICDPSCPMQPELHFIHHIGSGNVLCGTLVRTVKEDWPWQADLVDGSGVRIQCCGKGDHQSLYVSFRPQADTAWQDSFLANRPAKYAFYNANDHAERHRYVNIHAKGAQHFPLVGLTSGWLPASIPSNSTVRHSSTKVRVHFHPRFCDPFELSRAGQWPVAAPRGPPVQRYAEQTKQFGPTVLKRFNGQRQRHFQQPLKPNEVSFLGKSRDLYEGCRDSTEIITQSSLVRSSAAMPAQPLLSILCFRWYDYWSHANWSDYSVLSDGMVYDVLDGFRSPKELLHGDYEVFTIFIRDSDDLTQLDPKQLRVLLRGVNVIAWYFLWPVACSQQPPWGFVRERDLFAFMHAMEHNSIRTGWPHPAHVYKQLCGKLWIPQMCLNADYCVPATTRIHYADFKRDASKAASRALKHLMHVRRVVWEKEPLSLEDFRGVLKLGFSWGGLDVLPFKGVHSLIKNLKTLLNHRDCQNVVCVLQEMVPNVVAEHRIHCFYNRRKGSFHKEPVWVMVGRPGVHGKHSMVSFDIPDFQLASSEVLARQDAIRQVFKGDMKALVDAEQKASNIVDKWLLWFATESSDPPQVVRIDFLVAHYARGLASVWTCEVGECGASLCSIEVHARNIAALNNAVLNDPSGRFPMPLPFPLLRNSGWKS